MDVAYNTLTSAITCMMQEAGQSPRNLLKSWGEMRAAQNAVEAFSALPEDDPKVRMILKACGGQFQGQIGDWLKDQRTEAKAVEGKA